MTEFPVTLDNLISFVKALHPDGGPLDNLSDAVSVGGRLDERADSLIGHFVDQARRSGASWSEIGSSMGVSKQAAQKRFVFRWDDEDTLTPGRRFSRFTDRARRCVLAAQTTARAAGAPAVDVAHLAVALTTEPQGFAAIIILTAGVTDAQLRAALLPTAAAPDPTSESAGEPAATSDRLSFTEAAHSALEATLPTALRLGHNYIGTEHILLGILAENSETSARLTELGISTEFVEQEFAALITRHKNAFPRK
jgi:Clp amino terminal domain, pathogenicity island component